MDKHSDAPYRRSSSAKAAHKPSALSTGSVKNPLHETGGLVRQVEDDACALIHFGDDSQPPSELLRPGGHIPQSMP